MNSKPHLLLISLASPPLPSNISTWKVILDPATMAYSCGQDDQAIAQAVSIAHELLDLQA